MIRFQCPTCLKNLKAPDDGAGHKTHCPRCGQRLLVPPPAQTPERNKTILGQLAPSPSEGLDEVRAAEGKSKPPSVSQQPSGHAFFECPSCHIALNVPKRLIGRMVACPKCQTAFAALAVDDAQDNAQVGGFFNSETKAGQLHQTKAEYSPSGTDEYEDDERAADEKYCHECGAVIRTRAAICPNCGVQQTVQVGDGPSLEPHRGTSILVLGILGLILFWPLGLIAWLWANEDLRKMNHGIMDPEGQGLTEAGRICGMIATILFLVVVGLIGLHLSMCGILLPVGR